jgi:hypothetical protein
MYNPPVLKALSKKKQPKYIYRVEYIDDKYQGSGVLNNKCKSNWRDLPTPQCEITSLDNLVYNDYHSKFSDLRNPIVCGCSSLSQLYKWWPKDKIKDMKKGSRLVKLEAKGYVCVLNKQVTFNRAKARIVEVIHEGTK